ncbi:MAG: hypothetical protein NZ959_03330 [Armatimonadetes bacterium]|nr:hypothetical protein [Armatimonadota bacterium]MDW8121308.1 hypothetical protein [Armatimonadota bacterium]
MTGFLRYRDGRVSALVGLTETEFMEQWLMRTIAPQKTWLFLPTILPIGENLTSPLGALVPVLGLETDGTVCGVLFDLKEQRPFSAILGEALDVLRWVEKMDERELELLARYFWQEPSASLRGTAEKNWGSRWIATSIGGKGKVYILTFRPVPLLVEFHSFLQKQGLPIQTLRLHTLQGKEGEIVAIAEAVALPVSGSVEAPASGDWSKVGNGEKFLESLEEDK